MPKVFILQHVHTVDSDTEDTKMIGVYSTEDRAKSAVDRLASQPGFKETADGFSIDAYDIDKDHWTEGYISWAEAIDAQAACPRTIEMNEAGG